jgi:hypothetical protein
MARPSTGACANPFAELTTQLLHDLDPSELETTMRVLREVTDRAESLSAH